MAFGLSKTVKKEAVTEEKKEVRKIVSVVGEDAEDIVYITGRLLGHGTLPVLIVDNTPDHILFRSVGHDTDRETVYEKNLTIVKDVMYTDGLLSDFNFVIVYHGMYPDKTWWEQSDIMFAVSDFERFAMKDLGSRLYGLKKDNVGLIIKKRYLDKVHDTLIPKMLGLPKDSLEIAQEIPADERAEAVRLMFEYDGTLKVGSIPNEMKKAVYSMYTLIAEPDKKEKMASVFSEAD